MQQFSLPSNIFVDAIPRRDTHAVSIQLEESTLTIIWPTAGEDLQVVTYEAGPGKNLVTIYRDMIEADVCVRFLDLELEDWVEYQRGIDHAAQVGSRTDAPIRVE